MKKFFVLSILVTLITSCGTTASVSRFVKQAPPLGITKSEFLTIYGTPLRQNIFYDENGIYCEELVYRELLQIPNEIWYLPNEYHMINSIFLFRNGKLENQFQESDYEYQYSQEREKDRQLIREQIDAENKRVEMEKECEETD